MCSDAGGDARRHFGAALRQATRHDAEEPSRRLAGRRAIIDQVTAHFTCA